MTRVYHGTILSYATEIASRGAILSYFQQRKEWLEELVRRGAAKFNSHEELEAEARRLAIGLFGKDEETRATHISVSTELEIATHYISSRGLVLGIEVSNEEIDKWCWNGINPACLLIPNNLPITNLKEIYLPKNLASEKLRTAQAFARFNPSFLEF